MLSIHVSPTETNRVKKKYLPLCNIFWFRKTFIHMLFCRLASTPFHSVKVLACLKLILFYNTHDAHADVIAHLLQSIVFSQTVAERS